MARKSTKPRLRRPPRELTDKALRFAHEYPIDLNGAKAAERAGYSKGSAAVTASRLLTNANVLKIIEQQADHRIRKLDLRAEDVLRRIMQMAGGDIRRLVDASGRLRQLQDLEPDVEVLIAGMKISEHGVTEIKITDRLKALALLMQHFDLLRSKLDVHHTGAVGLLEEETMRHMSDEKLAELKVHTAAVVKLMGA